jgi:hypothetical protein
VQPDVHGPVVDDLDFVKVKVCVKAEVFLDDALNVFVVRWLALWRKYEP